jgi:hypothetical protein
MKATVAAIAAIFGASTLAGCESSTEYDGVSRFAAAPFDSASTPVPAPDAPEIPGRTDQDTLGGKLDGPPGQSVPDGDHG